MPRSSLFSTGFLGVFLISGIGAFVAAPGWLKDRARARRAANERAVGSTLKGLAAAQAEYRGDDVDKNGIQDYWTGDVAGLHAVGLIDLETAMADLRPIVPLCPKPVPKNGFFYAALEFDGSIEPPEPYRQVTDAASGPVHHRTRFGFVAIPAEYGVTGRVVVAINEGNSLWGYRMDDSALGLRRWPSDAERRRAWSRFG